MFDTFHSPFPLGNRDAIRVTASCAFDAWTTDTLVAPPSAGEAVHIESLGGCVWTFTVGVSRGSTNNVPWIRESLGHYTECLEGQLYVGVGDTGRESFWLIPRPE